MRKRKEDEERILRLETELERERQELRKIKEQLVKGNDKKYPNYQNNYNIERKIILDDDIPHIESCYAIIILVVNFFIPGLGTMIIGCMSANCCKFFCLGVGQIILGSLITFIIGSLTGSLYNFRMETYRYFTFSNLLITLLSALWPLDTSIRLYKLSY
jgi:hypothetical protein